MKHKAKEVQAVIGEIDLDRQFYAVMMGGGLLDFGRRDPIHTACPAKAKKSEYGGAINNLRAAIRARQSA